MFKEKKEYKEAFYALIRSNNNSQGGRTEGVNNLIESHINSFGKRPPEKDLSILTNFIMDDDLTTTNKRIKREVNHLSPRQYRTRQANEFYYEGLEDGENYISNLIYQSRQYGSSSAPFEKMQRAINRTKLTKTQKQLIELFLAGKSKEEVAAIQNITIREVNRKFNRTVERIRGGAKIGKKI